MKTKVIKWAWLVLAAVAVVAASCSTETEEHPTATPALTAPPPSVRVGDLLASRPAAFQVTYRWSGDLTTGGEAMVVVRHRGARERWDWFLPHPIPRGDMVVVEGTCEGLLPRVLDPECPGGRALATRYSCSLLPEESSDEFKASCSSGVGLGGANALSLALDSRTTKKLADRRIVSRDAECYAFRNLNGSEGEACIEPATHVLLYMSGRTGLTSNDEVIIEATSVSDAPSDMGDAALDAELLPAGQTSHQTVISLGALKFPPEFNMAR